MRNVSLSGVSMMRGMAAKWTTASIFGARSEGANSCTSRVLVSALNTCPESVMSVISVRTLGLSSGFVSRFSTA